MPALLKLQKNSIGIGDRFAREAKPQLRACILAEQQGLAIIPVWNKSNREHAIIGSEPAATRTAADAAVTELSWRHQYFVDADHVGMKTVDRFLPYANFFTVDVADWIGKPADAEAARGFVRSHPELTGRIELCDLIEPLVTTRPLIERTAAKDLAAIDEAGRAYRHIASA